MPRFTIDAERWEQLRYERHREVKGVIKEFSICSTFLTIEMKLRECGVFFF